MFSTYITAREWLESFIPLVYGKEELGLARIENLLNKLGNPQKKFRSILVGGTSGKGSTAYYIARLLQFSENSDKPENQKTRINQKARVSDNSENLKVRKSEYSEFSEFKIGLHVSPHLIYIGERMQILDNRKQETGNRKQKEDNAIPVKRLVALVNEIKPVVDAIGVSQPELLPSYFEILVALSFLYFAKEKVDFAVVEVGLGGRLDATNILESEISVITNVGLDHTEILGNTIEKIAREKAGIIKKVSKVSNGSTPIKSGSKVSKGVPVVTGASGKALEIIKKRAKEKNALLINFGTLPTNKTAKTDIERYITRYYYSLRSPDVSFVSRNKNLALLTVLSLGIKQDADSVKKAFSTGFPGRFEEADPTSPKGLRGTSSVILDGAHNPDKIRALIDFIKSSWFIVRGSRKIVLVIAFKKGKNWKEMIDLLLKSLSIKKVIATEYFATTDTGKGSAVDAGEIKKYVEVRGQRLEVEVIKNSQEAVFEALSSNKLTPNQLIIVTGSLYLVGEARTLWKLPEF